MLFEKIDAETFTGYISIIFIVILFISFYIIKNSNIKFKKQNKQKSKYNSGKWMKVVLSSGKTFYKYYDPKKGIEKAVDLPYKKKDILTPLERNFWKVLKPKCDKYNILICPKVRLEDIIDIDISNYKEKQSLRGRVKSRHIDFLLCDNNMNTLAAIELDDSTHNKDDAIKTDAFKDTVFETIGIPLYRVRVNEFLYNMRIDDILNQIIPKISSSNNQESINIFRDYENKNNEP